MTVIAVVAFQFLFYKHLRKIASMYVRAVWGLYCLYNDLKSTIGGKKKIEILTVHIYASAFGS